MLEFDPAWRRSPPGSDLFETREISSVAADRYLGLIRQIAVRSPGPDQQFVYEHFKQVFAGAIGEPYYRSSSTSWAEHDLEYVLRVARANAPVFIEAMYIGLERIRARQENDRSSAFYVPGPAELNDIATDFGIGYLVDPPSLILRSPGTTVVQVPTRPVSLNEQAFEAFERSLRESRAHLSQGRHRQAVQESLWLLESVATVFAGSEVGDGTVQGRYFNKIAHDLRTLGRGTVLERVVEWMTSLHGFLSSPTGGGVRHGTDFNEFREMSRREAELFCNLINSYLAFLLAEHEVVSREPTDDSPSG
jgi:hypothetical protein